MTQCFPQGNKILRVIIQLCKHGEGKNLRPRLQEYVFIENDIVFKENATTVLHLHIVFVSFSYPLKPSTRKRWKRLKTVKTAEIYCLYVKIIWIICGCCCNVFKSLLFSVKTIRLHDNDIIRPMQRYLLQIFPLLIPFSKVIVFSENDYRFWSFSCRCKIKTQRKFAVSMKTICRLQKAMKTTEKGKNSGNLLFACHTLDTIFKSYCFQWKWSSFTIVFA